MGREIGALEAELEATESSGEGLNDDTDAIWQRLRILAVEESALKETRDRYSTVRAAYIDAPTATVRVSSGSVVGGSRRCF